MGIETQMKHEVLKWLYDAQIIQFGEFILASGAKSSFYIDLRLVPSYPEIFQGLCKHACTIIKEKELDEQIDAVVGIPLAGIPYATLISTYLNKPLLLLRKETKDHGTKKLLEGKYYSGQRILLVDDLITSGSSKLESLVQLRDLELKVDHLFVFINRSIGAINDLQNELSVTITCILDLKDLLEAKLVK